MKKGILFIVFSLFIFSCKENDDFYENKPTSGESIEYSMKTDTESEKPDIQSQIILGQKLENPYSVDNMQDAFEYYNNVVPNSPFLNKVVTTTHKYVKILPNNISHLEVLDSLDKSDEESAIVLHDFPLDYEILEDGDYYVEPTDENDLYHPIYTVIPMGYTLPGNLPYEVLENLYEPSEEEYDVETVALFFADWEDDLESDGIKDLTEENLPEYLNNIKEEGELFGKRYRPNGYVKVQNTFNYQYDNLQYAKISIGRGIWWKYTYTDNNGYFNSPKKYRGKVRIRAKWRSYTATIRKTWNEILGIQVSDHLMTLTRGTNGRTKYIDYTEPHTGAGGIDLAGGHLWFKGTVHNGIVKYNSYCISQGIVHLVLDANVWVWAKGNDASTPMLYKYKQLPYLAQLAGVGQANFWNVLTNIVSGNLIALVPSHLRPDHIYAGLKNRNIKEGGPSSTLLINQLVFHESGHFSHATKTGANYWANVFASEISNQIHQGHPYSDGTKPSLQAGKRIALAEGWATMTEFKATLHYYNRAEISISTGKLVTVDINNLLEHFDVYDVPMRPSRFDDQSWFLHGIMWDLLDNNVDGIESEHNNSNGIFINQIGDNVYLGNSLSIIFNRLNSNVHNHNDFENSLLTAYPDPVIQELLAALFQTYGYSN